MAASRSGLTAASGHRCLNDRSASIAAFATAAAALPVAVAAITGITAITAITGITGIIGITAAIRPAAVAMTSVLPSNEMLAKLPPQSTNTPLLCAAAAPRRSGAQSGK